MAGEKEHIPTVTIELKVYMHCKACETSVSKTLHKCKGVKDVKVQMEEHKATVIGQFDPAKVLKKLKKKTGKIAKIIEEVDGKQIKDETNLIHDNSTKHSVDLEDGDGTVVDNCNGYPLINVYMFSDENPNACSIM